VRKGTEILALLAAGGPDIRELSCTFPTHQGMAPRDEFAPDSTHRQLVRVIRDCDAGGPPKLRVYAGFG
jgi:hypothetical protein